MSFSPVKEFTWSNIYTFLHIFLHLLDEEDKNERNSEKNKNENNTEELKESAKDEAEEQKEKSGWWKLSWLSLYLAGWNLIIQPLFSSSNCGIIRRTKREDSFLARVSTFSWSHKSHYRTSNIWKRRHVWLWENWGHWGVRHIHDYMLWSCVW